MTRTPARAARPSRGIARSTAGMDPTVLDEMTTARWLCLVAAALCGAALAAGIATAPSLDLLLGLLCVLIPLSVALGWAMPPLTARVATATVAVGLCALASVHVPAGGGRVLWAAVVVLAASSLGLEVTLQVRRHLRGALRTDPLTGLMNRRALRIGARTLVGEPPAHGLREAPRHWVIAIDLDGLKPVNDRYGHAEGDRLLSECAHAWRAALGRMGIIGRWGGDEFVAVVEAADRGAARRVLRRLRAAAPHAFSAGLAPLTAQRGLDAAVREADAQLYREKQVASGLGRGRSAPAVTRATAVVAPQPAAAARSGWTSDFSRAVAAAAGLIALAAVPDAVSAEGGLRVAAAADVVIAGTVAATALTRGVRARQGLLTGWITLTAVTAFTRVALAADPPSMVVALVGVQAVAILLAAYWRPSAARVLFGAPMAAALAGVAVHTVPGATALPLTAPAAVVLAVGGVLGWLLIEVVSAARGRLLSLVHRDELTGALDRWGTDDALERLVLRARRTRRPLTVVAIDFDRFKQLNDAHGHERGDQALQRAVAEWSEMLGADDVIGRIGGDEFVIALADCDEAEAAEIVARLRAGATDPWTSGSATLARRESATSLTRRADRMLGAAKRGAREAREARRRVEGAQAAPAADRRPTQRPAARPEAGRDAVVELRRSA